MRNLIPIFFTYQIYLMVCSDRGIKSVIRRSEFRRRIPWYMLAAEMAMQAALCAFLFCFVWIYSRPV